MNRILLHPVGLLLAASGVLLAQQNPMPAARDAYGQAQPSANRPPAAQPPSQAYGVPPEVTLKPGTMLTIRVSQKLADNKNAVGDTFSGALTAPLVANGIVVAQRGSMVYGKVVEAQKVKGVHRLGVEVTGITLADGSQTPVHGQLMARQSPPMPYWEQQRGNITTAAADGSAGATVGVLATKGHDSVIYPETLLTFQTGSAITVTTANSAGAFRYVGPDDYNRPAGMTTHVATRPGYAYSPGYPYYDYPYYGWGYPYPYWGPVGFGFGFGGFYGGGFHGGGFHGRFR
ncbi:MAG TPA: hypothetical protein VHW09_01590 [Bryobacteraceae bacterium]|jgi:hypothetical protein|nr:hypothetical protein [Bryobacteraceae bacterium]